MGPLSAKSVFLVISIEYALSEPDATGEASEWCWDEQAREADALVRRGLRTAAADRLAREDEAAGAARESVREAEREAVR